MLVVAQQFDFGQQFPSGLVGVLNRQVLDQAAGFGQLTLAGERLGAAALRLQDKVGVVHFLQPCLSGRFIQTLFGDLGQTQVGLRQAALWWIGLVLNQAQVAFQSHFGGFEAVFIHMQQTQHQPSLRHLGLGLRHVLQLAQSSGVQLVFQLPLDQAQAELGLLHFGQGQVQQIQCPWDIFLQQF